MGWIFLFPVLIVLLLLVNQFWAASPITASLNENQITLGPITMGYFDLLRYMVLPIAVWVLGIPVVITSQRMGSFRHPYLIFAIPGLILLFAWPLLQAFIYLFRFVPAVSSALGRFIPESVVVILETISGLIALGFGAWLLAICIFAIVYNVNYPAKYEEIYRLRKKRLKSYRNLDQREAYKARFYRDYKRANWDSMLKDFFCDILNNESNDPIPYDAYLFIREANGTNEERISHRVLDTYKDNERYWEIRKMYHDNQHIADVVDNNGKINLPPRVKEVKKVKKPGKPKVKVVVESTRNGGSNIPPLQRDLVKATDPTSKKWSPDDIA